MSGRVQASPSLLSPGACAASDPGTAEGRDDHGVGRLDLFVTEACNLACAYCFAATQPRKSPNLAQAQRAVDWLFRSRAPRLHITFWGGEPMLRLGYLEAVVEQSTALAAVTGKTVTYSMPTNASLLDDDTLAFLRRHRIKIFLSIDGDEAAQAGRPLRSGESSHALVARGMGRAFAQPADRRPAVRMTVAPANAPGVADSVRYFLEHGAKEVLVYPAMDLPWTKEQLDGFAAGQMELASLVAERFRSAADPRALPVVKPLHGTLRRLYRGTPPRRRTGKAHHCGAGAGLVALTVTGSFVPCHRYVFYGRRRNEDDVAQGALGQGPSSPPAAAGVDLAITDLVGERRCIDCDLFDLCTYGCVAISYAVNGRPDRIPVAACALVRAQIDAARWLHRELEADARYPLYLGEQLDRTLSRTARRLGAVARAGHRHRRGEPPMANGTPRGHDSPPFDSMP